MRSRRGWQWGQVSLVHVAAVSCVSWLMVVSSPFGHFVSSRLLYATGEGVGSRYRWGVTVSEQVWRRKSRTVLRSRCVVTSLLLVILMGCGGAGTEGSGSEFLSCVEEQGGTNEAADWCADQLGYRPGGDD